MLNRELTRQLQRIEELIRRTQAATAGDLELQTHWARYLCVLAAGYLENSLTLVYSDFVARAASAPVAAYAGAELARLQNPKTRRFIETAAAFKPMWGDELTAFVDQEGRREAIDSIMANRHIIAHGGDTGLTIARVKRWLELSVEVIEYIDIQCRR